MRFTAIALCLVFGAWGQASGQTRWKTVNVNGLDSVSVDTETIRKLAGPQQWQVWLKWTFAKGIEVVGAKGQRFHHANEQTEVDCSRLSTRTRALTQYYVDGEVAWTAEKKAEWSSWSDAPPESVAESTFKGLCKYLKSRR